MAPIPNALVTASAPGIPTLSGYTNANGQVALPMNPSVTYNLTFSGTAVGKVANFKPAVTTFTLYNVKNKGAKSFSLSGQKIAAGKSVYAYHGTLPIKTTQAFSKWQPAKYFKNSKSKSTSLIMPQSNISVSFVSAVKKMYVVDGGTSSSPFNNNNAYDPSTNTWSVKTGDTTARRHLAAGVIGSKLYAIDGFQTLNSNHAYDPSTNTWSTKASDTTGRYNLSIGVIGSKLYAVDGHSAVAGFTKINHAYDPSTNTWSTKASDTTARYGIAAGVIGSKLYAVDGWVTGVTGTNHAYDPSTNTWSTKAADVTNRYFPSAGVIGSKLYAVDGFSGSSATLSNNNAYDPSTNTWSTKAVDPTRRGGAAAGVI